MQHLDLIWDHNKRKSDHDLLRELVETANLEPVSRASIQARATGYVQAVRAEASPGLMEAFLAEYGLSSNEGVALMCLAEAILRIPDARTLDALIDDKIAGANWARHLNQSGSTLVNSSTLGLLLTQQVLGPGGEGAAEALQGLVRRIGTPAIRAAVKAVIRQMGQIGRAHV